MQKDQDWSGAGGLVEGLRLARGKGWGPLGGTWALHAQGGFEEGLRAPRWRQGSCCSQSVCDLLPTTKGSHSLPPTPHPPTPPPSHPFFSFFNVLIVPTVSSGRGTRGGEWRLGKGPLLPEPQGFT